MTHHDPEPDDDNGPWCQNGAAMNKTRHYTRGTTAGAILCTAGACYTATISLWLAGSGLYAAAVLAWCAARERHHQHARERAIAQRLERLARGEAVIEPPRPCCRFWVHSDGAIHGHDCTRPPAARTTLSLAEQQALEEITAHYGEDTAA